jgi:hypothetical protein
LNTRKAFIDIYSKQGSMTIADRLDACKSTCGDGIAAAGHSSYCLQSGSPWKLFAAMPVILRNRPYSTTATMHSVSCRTGKFSTSMS